jgi:predicted O-methyltransferase YrrM
MDANETFYQLTTKAMLASWDESIPSNHRNMIELCLGNSSLGQKDLAVLYEFARLQKPCSVIEVGLANGSSAVCNILSAASSINNYIMIDPFQKSFFHNKGINAVQKSATDTMNISMLETFSYLALPKLLFEGHKFDYAFIDASHMFDATLIEFFYIDKMLDDGGVVIMDDRPWPMVGGVVNFLKENYVHYCVDCRHQRLTFFLKKHKDTRKWYDFRHFEIPISELFESRIENLQREKGSAFEIK